jgi:hypothetical protein
MAASLGCFFADLSYSLRIARLASSFFMLAMRTFFMLAMPTLPAGTFAFEQLTKPKWRHGDRRTVLSPVQADGIWRVSDHMGQRQHRIGKFGTKQEAERWIADHCWLT